MRTSDVVRELGREAELPVPDVWGLAADVVRAELEDRAARDPLFGLSRSAMVLLIYLRGRGGWVPLRPASGAPVNGRVAFEVALDVDIAEGLPELMSRGLVCESWAAEEDGGVVRVLEVLWWGELE